MGIDLPSILGNNKVLIYDETIYGFNKKVTLASFSGQVDTLYTHIFG